MDASATAFDYDLYVCTFLIFDIAPNDDLYVCTERQKKDSNTEGVSENAEKIECCCGINNGYWGWRLVAKTSWEI